MRAGISHNLKFLYTFAACGEKPTCVHICWENIGLATLYRSLVQSIGSALEAVPVLQPSRHFAPPQIYSCKYRNIRISASFRRNHSYPSPIAYSVALIDWIIFKYIYLHAHRYDFFFALFSQDAFANDTGAKGGRDKPKPPSQPPQQPQPRPGKRGGRGPQEPTDPKTREYTA